MRLKNKILSIGLLLGSIILTSCNTDIVNSNFSSSSSSSSKVTTTMLPTDPTGLDIFINFEGNQGISLRENKYKNIIENKTYVKGDLLPTWEYFSEKIGVSIRDASGYKTYNNDDTYELFKDNNYMSESKENEYVDLFYNSISNINEMAKEGKVINLLDYIDNMPNFKYFLECNPSIGHQIMQDNAIYFTPHFNGYNEIENTFIMDTKMVKSVLDSYSIDSFDTTVNGGLNPAKNVVQAGKYTAYIDHEFNYPNENTEVLVSKYPNTENIIIKQTKNIITAQNELLASGCTGKELAAQFKDYLSAAFGHLVGIGKTFNNYSDIFISESAAYNADELIALMRVIKANPGLLTGDPTAEIEIFMPIGATNNHVDSILDFMQIWGIQGLDSKYDMLYFDANGKINDAASTIQTYHGLKYLSALYDEGLILENFWESKSNSTGNDYLNKYFAKTLKNSGHGFITYGYPETAGLANDIAEGIGTSSNKRNDIYKDYSITGIMPVLPPLSYWATEFYWSVDQSLTDHYGKTLLRYTESSRSLKPNSWCIPSSSDNIDKAVELMDYMFTDEGMNVQSFGPSQYWKESSTPVISDDTKTMFMSSNTDYKTFMKKYIGSNHEIGYITSNDLNNQIINQYANEGLTNVQKAYGMGVLLLSNEYSPYKFSIIIPSLGYGILNKDTVNSYDVVKSFWDSNKCSKTSHGWASIVAGGYDKFSSTSTEIIGKSNLSGDDYSFKDVYDQIDERRSVYLYEILVGLDYNLVPDYAYPII